MIRKVCYCCNDIVDERLSLKHKGHVVCPSCGCLDEHEFPKVVALNRIATNVELLNDTLKAYSLYSFNKGSSLQTNVEVK